MEPQLLNLFEEQYTFDSFIGPNNDFIVQALKSQSNSFINIIGSDLSGKTHLLHAWVQYKQQQQLSAIYIDIKNNQNIFAKDVLANYACIAIDNIHALTQTQQVELFDLFNSIKLANLNNFLLTSSKFYLEHSNNIRLDLKNRILSGLNLTLKLADDKELVETLSYIAYKKGINIHTQELKYIVNNYSRNLGNLIKILHKVTHLAVLSKRNITIPLIKEALY